MENGFKVVSLQEFRDMKISTIDPRPRVVFVNRRDVFKPPEDLLARTRDLMRRKKSDNNIDPYRRDGYEREYRNKIVRSGDALKLLRKMAAESRKRPVVLVKGKDGRPDANILVMIAKTYMDREIW